VYSNIIINTNDFDIMVTLNSVYFEYIKLLCKIFAKYIVPILQVIQTMLLYFLKWLKMKYIIIIITCDKKTKFQYYLLLKF